MTSLAEIAQLFLKLGTIGFGGPAAHIALMDKEVVERRGWLSRQQFLDLLGATTLIPGPNSTEMAISIGYLRAGFLGMLVAGLCFIVPAALITGAIAHFYVEYGALPQVQPILRGITPVVFVVIVDALVRLGRKAVKTWMLLVLALAVAGASLAGCDQVLSLLAGALVGTIFLKLWSRKGPAAATGLLVGAALGSSAATASAAAASASGSTLATVSLWKLALFFLKVGAVLYGGGYVLIAYLEGDLVRNYGWLSERQLLDAVAVGQFTPGPLLSTATFVGYVISREATGNGWPGAAVATASIFLPSFVLVAAISPLVPRLRRSAWASPVLDSVNAGSLGLMAVAAVMLARTSLLGPTTGFPDARSCLIALAAAGALWRWKPAAAWLVLAGAAAGWLMY